INTDSSEDRGIRDGSDAVRTKSFSKTFPADQTDKISLNNQFGSMQIKTWDKKEVKVDVSIRVYSTNEKEAQYMIDLINIEAQKNGDAISFKTVLNPGKRMYERSKKREMKVDYVVYLPSSNALTLSQQFGNVTMGDFSGPLSARIQYGDFNAGNLSGANNYINVQYGKTGIEELNKATIKQQYGSGLIIGTAGELDLNAQYASVTVSTIKRDAVIKQEYGSGLTVGTVGNLDLNVQYANVNIGTIRGNAVIRQQYNELTLGSVGKLDLRSEYSGVTIGTLKGDGNFKMSYNRVNIAEITPGCRNLTVDVDYVEVNLNFADNYNADFTVQKSYGGFRYGSNVKATLAGGDNEERRGSSTKNYSGKIGNGGSATVRIKADYGSVVFK
ncbi:MAG TPA: hypothetical protein VGC08_06340, partial [Pedobacter sp.]